MNPILRPATPDDLDDVVAFTTGTFEWGDYVPDSFLGWLEEEGSHAMVAEVGGTVRALARVRLVSPNEAWAGGMRVHPDFRRMGLGAAVSRDLWTWATDHGAQVVRLLTEGWNEPAAAMVAAMGFRPVARWVRADRGIGDNSPFPDGNGGLRVKPPESLRPATSADIEAALMAWSAGGLERDSHGLGTFRWTWRRFDRDDVIAAARRNALWSGRPGWAIADIGDSTLYVSWVVTAEDDAESMALALVDMASRAGVETLDVRVPQIDWLVRALRRHQCEVSPLTVHALPL